MTPSLEDAIQLQTTIDQLDATRANLVAQRDATLRNLMKAGVSGYRIAQALGLAQSTISKIRAAE